MIGKPIEVSSQPLITREAATPTKVIYILLIVFAILFFLTGVGLFTEGFALIQLINEVNEIKIYVDFKE